MRTTKLALFLLLVTFCNSQDFGDPVFVGALTQTATVATSDPLLPYLVNETFDTASGYDLGASWTEVVAGVIDEDEQSVVGAGTESLEFDSSADTDYTWIAFTAGDTMYCHFMWRYSSLSGTTTILRFTTDSTSFRSRILTSTSGVLTIAQGGASAAVTDAIPADTWVHIWTRYTKESVDTALDGYADVAWSTTTTRPTTGTKFQSVNTGSAEQQVGRVYVGQDASETHTMYYDNVWVDEAGYPQP